MSKLSSESLFHYVEKKEYLIDILENNFRPRYVIEKMYFDEEDYFEVGIPMLCFCDIKLANIEEHTNWYGNYGIGMKKEWAIRNGLTPVHYYNKDSHLSNEIKTGISIFRELIKNEQVPNEFKTKHSEIFHSLYYNFWFMKSYEGEQFFKHTDKIEYKKFYDEREWRYIPSTTSLKAMREELPMSLLNKRLAIYRSDADYKNRINTELGEDTKLYFIPDDIAYIIIRNEAERTELINAIKSTKLVYCIGTVETLSSKIISLDQIKSDF